MRLRTVPAVLLPLLAACSTPQSDAAQSSDSASPTGAAAPAGPAPDLVALRRMVDSGNAAYIAAVTKSDVAATVAGYAPDAMLLPPNEPMARGREAIVEKFKAWNAAQTVKAMTLRTEDLTASGDLAVEVGTYEMTLQPTNGGKEIQDKGKYVVVYKRQPDGTWKNFREVSNSDAPAKR